ncbi:MAG: trehalose-phosphatase [Alphaproteobacteria bacterium]
MFLDVDGTIVDIAPEPASVRVEPALADTLADIAAALDGAFALVSGRPIADLDRLFAPRCFAAAGQHGAEWRRRADGPRETLPDGDFDPDLAQHIAEFAAQWPDVLVERKPSCVALHFRRNPALGLAIQEQLVPLLQRQAPHFELLAGKLVWEVRRSGVDKGRALALLMDAPPFKGRTPIFIGDDHTDEDAMAEAERRGGRALAVGDLNVARWGKAFEDAAEVRAWLMTLPAFLGKRK